MWFWKIYAIVRLIVTVPGTIIGVPEWIDDPELIVMSVLSLIALVAIFAFAFQRPVLPGQHWWWFALFYLGYTAIDFRHGIGGVLSDPQFATDAAHAFGGAVGIILALGLIALEMIPVFLYGFRQSSFAKKAA